MIPGQNNIPMATFLPDNPVLSSILLNTPLISAISAAISEQDNLSSAGLTTFTF